MTRVLIDTPPDLREQLLDACVDWVDAVLFTHEHADHTHGIDDLRPLFIHRRRRVDGETLVDLAADAGSRALFLAGDADADERFERARDALVETDDYGTAAECEAFIARICWFRGEQQEVFEHLREGPRAVGELAAEMPVSRPAVSQHLKVLAEAGLVARESAGTRNLYRPEAAGIASMRGFFDSLWDVGLARFKSAAEAVARSHHKEKP